MEINGLSALKKYATEGQQIANTAATGKVFSGSDSASALLDNRDKLSISPDAQTARLKALLGFDPSGRITKKDFEEVIATDKEYVSGYLEEAASFFDISSGSNFSIYADDDGGIHVKGRINNKSELEEALNADEDFVKAFNRLSTNKRITDYAAQLTVGPQNHLIDYLDNSSSTAFDSLIGGYEQARRMNDPFNALLFYSRSYTSPYEMKFEVG